MNAQPDQPALPRDSSEAPASTRESAGKPGARIARATPGKAPVHAARDALGTGEVWHRFDLAEPAPYLIGEYVRRLAWNVVRVTLFRCSLSRMHRFRRVLLRMFGATIGKNVAIRPSVRVFHPWLLTVGDYSSIGDRVEVYNLGPIVIGSHTAVSQNAHLCAGTHDYMQSHLPLIRASLTLGSGVWVCADAFIGPGVVVGDNTIVGACAVVSKDLPPGVVAAGNPAQVVRERKRPRTSTGA